MLHLKSLLTSVLFFLVCGFTLVAQTGSIKGTIKDAKTNEPLIGAAVAIQGTTNGSITDVEGNFLIAKAPVGKQNISITYISYQTKLIEVTVEAGKQIILNTALDEDAGQTLQEVVVTASRATNTEVAVISEIKSIQQVAVGVSAQQIAKSPDRDAAQIARRVPGVSIVDNRFVLVRGLSQRYNSVMINDVITPSTEVDVRSFSFDMVPSSIIDRMLIFKSGAAELPGEFAGGVVKVYTRSAPEENFTNIGIGLGVRGNTTFQNVDSYKGGKLDFLGVDDGNRALPGGFPSTSRRFNALSATQRAQQVNRLPNSWGIENKTVLPDFRFSFNIGRRFNLGSVQSGTITSLNYSYTNQFSDVDNNTFENGTAVGIKQLDYQDKLYGTNTRLGLLHNWFFRFNPNFTLEFKNLFNQLGFAETNVRTGFNANSDNNVLSYSERFESRSIYSGQLIGKHSFNQSKTSLTWIGGFGYTRRTEPDWKRATYQRGVDEQSFSLVAPIDPNPITAGRFFSKLNESVFTVAANAEHKLGANDNPDPIKLKAGLYLERKDRSFNARFFGLVSNNPGNGNPRLPIGQVFSPSNIGGTSNTYNYLEGTQDGYDANNTLVAGYVGAHIPLSERFSATLGLRLESNQQQLTNTSSRQQVTLPQTVLLPSANLVYNLTDKQLVRAAYSYTVNRPEFRELANFNFYDFNRNADVFGNPLLKNATIHNIDTRWEYYPTPNELISFGVFYKQFKNPVEDFTQPSSSGNVTYTYVNANRSKSYGIETEIRKSLVGLGVGRFWENLSLIANASYIYSRVELQDTILVPSTVSANNKLYIGDVPDRNRPMVNQSPYLVNAGLYYSDVESGWQFSLLYNVYGKRIAAVGTNNNPTIYEMPRNVVDVTLTKTFNKKLELKASIQDLLNQPFRWEQNFISRRADGSADGTVIKNQQTMRSFRRGTYSVLTMTYTF